MEYTEALGSGSKKIPVVGTHEQYFIPCDVSPCYDI